MRRALKVLAGRGGLTGFQGQVRSVGNVTASTQASQNMHELRAANLSVSRAPSHRSPPQDLSALKFGKVFTNYMLQADWSVDRGWDAPLIKVHENFSLAPSASSLHYGLQCFEGLKAYLDPQKRIRLFRPEMNMKRMNLSAARLAMPTFDGQEYLECIKYLLQLEKPWIPDKWGYSLYIRPTMTSTDRDLGVGPAKQVRLYTILSPVGPYYPNGFAPIKLYADPHYVRAWPGGPGAAKQGGNYAPSILPQVLALKKGYAQVLWLFGEHHEVTEVGTMNLMCFWQNEQGEKELITAPLDGTILAGVTRDSILTLARQWNEFRVSEAKFTIHDVIKALKEKRVIEIFGCGTAAIVSPINGFHFDGVDYDVPLDASDPSAPIGKLAKRFSDTLMGIQYGRIEHEWSVVVDEHNDFNS